MDKAPLTTVGKIYKPKLRVEAAKPAVTELIFLVHIIPGAEITATDGGARGRRVSVTLPEQTRSAVSVVENALAEYLFSATVQIR